MSYARVIPRDLFNEASLLKCLGQLWLLIESHPGCSAHLGWLRPDLEGGAFEIDQDPADGSLRIFNLRLICQGRPVDLYRPLNSREPWPLYASCGDLDVEEIDVFDEHGQLSPDMRGLIGL